MIRIVKIGQKDIALEANAATSIRYKQIFRKDLLKELAKLEDKEDFEKIDIIQNIAQLAYTMNMQSQKKVKEASEDDYVAWLEAFEENDFQNTDTVIDILSVWNKNFETMGELKNEQSPQ